MQVGSEIFWVWVENSSLRADVCVCVCVCVCMYACLSCVCVCVCVCVYCAYIYVLVCVEDNAQRRAQNLHPLLREVRCECGTKLYYSEWTGHMATAPTTHSDTLCGSYISVYI